MLRPRAYQMTENDIRHFMLLLLADRVDVLKAAAKNLLKGQVPNMLGETGIKAEWERNPADFVKKAAVATAVAGIGYDLRKRRHAGR